MTFWVELIQRFLRFLKGDKLLVKEAKNNIQVNYGIWSWDDGILVGITEADQKDYEVFMLMIVIRQLRNMPEVKTEAKHGRLKMLMNMVKLF
jgi:hypothetical protein